MNVAMPDEAKLVVPVSSDPWPWSEKTGKLLVFPLAQIPEMSRGRGVRLQRYRTVAFRMLSSLR